MILFLKLIIAHFLGDFLFQPKSWVQQKESEKIKSPKLYLHALLHGVIVLILLWRIDYWLLALLISLSHLLIDLFKLYAQRQERSWIYFLLDQALHLLSICLLYGLFFEPQINLMDLVQLPSLWIYSCALIFLTAVSSIVMQVFMSNWSQALDQGSSLSLPNAGKYIGILERLFVFVFVITGHWEGIGFLIAAKSVLRFGDLKESKDRKLTEYILIGTLLSFAIALATGMLTLYLLAQLAPASL